MVDLSECRQKLDRIDTQIMELFMERQAVSAEVAAYKAASGKAVLDRAREREKIQRATELVPPELASYASVLQTVLMEASRDAQHQLLEDRTSDINGQIRDALAHQRSYFPFSATVACQGVEGAYQQIAVDRLFRKPQIEFCNSFEDVFDAVESGRTEFGVLPVQNSTAGAVHRGCDLTRPRRPGGRSGGLPAPAVEFSPGSTPNSVLPLSTASKTSSKLLQNSI